MNVKNLPKEARNYEFIVAYYDNSGLVYDSHFKNGFEAEQKASGIQDSIILHNVRIQGYRGGDGNA